MRRMRVEDLLRDRYTLGLPILIYITDRCPVGCAHCSVDSRRDSPTIKDHELFAELIDAICAEQSIRLVGISGGEPFVERRGLTLAMRRLSTVGKDIVLYTSGVWARPGLQPAWIREIIPMASCVVLSTDQFHAPAIGAERFISAARAIAAAGVPVICQVLNTPDEVGHAEELLADAFGQDWRQYADLSLTEPLPFGRGEGVFNRPPARPAASVGVCKTLASPTVRYDGTVIPCCNEPLIMGRGPTRMQVQTASGAELREALRTIREDALLDVIARTGAGAVTGHPAYADLAEIPVRSICELCWKLQDATTVPLGDRSDRILTALPLLVPAKQQAGLQGVDSALPDPGGQVPRRMVELD